jgi:hypothetical protein
VSALDRLFLLGFLLLIGCGEKEENSAAAERQEPLPGRSESRLPRDSEDADPRIALRESLDEAVRESDPEAREKLLEAVAWDAIDVDPELSREAFASLTPGSESSRRMVGHFAMRLADEDPDQALAWARGLEEEEERSDAFGRIAVVMSAEDPAAAATLVAEEMTAGTPRDRAVVQVLQRWSQAAPADAADWISGFPRGAARSAGLKAVAAAWIESDAPEFAAWVEATEDGPLRTEALLAAAEALRPGTPEIRAARLAHFQDAALRTQLESILSQSPP